MENKRNIIQIMPADGWAAAYREPWGNPTDYIYTPLVCWALVQEADGTTKLKGIEADPPCEPLWGKAPVSFCDDGNNFAGYERFKGDGTLCELSGNRGEVTK